MVADSLIVLSSVLVTASQPNFTPVQSITGEQLQAMSTNSVADVLKYFAGVQLKDYGGVGGMKTLNVRAMGTQHTGVYIDGIRITNCQNGTVDLSKYSIKNMEAVELYNANKTGVSLTASEYASASTVYFRTRRPTETKLEASFSTGSFHTNKAGIYAAYKNKMFLDLELLKSKGDYKFKYKSQYEDTTGVRRNTDIRYLRAESGYFTDNFRAHFYLYCSDRGLPGGVVKRLSDKYADVGREQDLNVFAQCSYQNEYKNWFLKTNHKYAVDKLHANTNYIENQFVRYDNTYLQTDFYNGLVVGYKSKFIQTSISPDLRISDLTCNVYGFDYVKRYDFKAVAALTAMYKGWALNASLLYTNVKDHSKMATADRMTRYTPTFSGSYQFKNLIVRTFYKSIFRAPTLNDFYYTHVGVRTLKPEYTKQYDVGLNYNTSNIQIQSDIYWNNVSDKIICIPNGASYDWKMVNKGSVKAFGWDTNLRVKYDKISAMISCTYQDVKDYSDKRDKLSYGHQLLYSPNWSVTAVVGFASKSFEATLSHMFVSKRWWTYASEDDYLEPYNTTDIRIVYKTKYGKVAANINNVFNKHYELVQRWPLPARQVELSFNIFIK